MTATLKQRLLDQAIVSLVFAALGLAALAWFVTFAEPQARHPRVTPKHTYTEQPLDAALAPGLADTVTAIAAASAPRPGERQEGRMSGSPGFYRTEALISNAFASAGLRVIPQEFEVTVPATALCEILDRAGKPLPGITLHPFSPSGLLPINCTVTGTLVTVEAATPRYLNGHAPAESIAVTAVDYGVSWMQLASLGIPAILVHEDDVANLLRVDPDAPAPWAAYAANSEIPFPRFLVRGPIDQFAGQEVVIRCKVHWETRTVRNLIGVLGAAVKPTEEALILTAFYDSHSLVPEIAPGAEQALPLATLLTYARALAPYREQLPRDVIFIATAGHAQSLAGVSRLLEAIEPFSRRRPGFSPFNQRLHAQEQQAAWAAEALDLLPLINTPAFPAHRATTDTTFRAWFDKGVRIAAGEVDLTMQEDVLRTRLNYLRAGSPVYRDGFDSRAATDAQRKDPANSHPLLQAYLEARQRENRAAGLVSAPLENLAQRDVFDSWNYPEQLRAFFTAAQRWHQQQIRELHDLIAVERLLGAYRQTLTINLELYSGGARQLEDLALLVGLRNAGSAVEPQVSDIAGLLTTKGAAPTGEPRLKVMQWGPRDALGSDAVPNRLSLQYVELESEPWFYCGRAAFTLTTHGFFPQKIATPEDRFDTLKLDALNRQLPAIGKTLLAMAFGEVEFRAVPEDPNRNLHCLRGTVRGQAGTSTMTTDHPMGLRTTARVYNINWNSQINDYATRGIRIYPILTANPYGEFEKALAYDIYRWGTASADALRTAPDGSVAFFKDQGAASQSIYPNEKIGMDTRMCNTGRAPTPLNIALFRCAPVALYELINPQTLQSFKGVSYLRQTGLSQPVRFCSRPYTAFQEPDFLFYIGLLEGSAENPDVLTPCAFLLNSPPDTPPLPDEPEVHGRGYLAADTPNLAFAYRDAASSMLRTAQKRLALQQRYGMADPLMLTLFTRAQARLKEAGEFWTKLRPADALRAAGSSLAYAITNHPVIRGRISEAILGVLWYLALLVPFVFFSEKLLFGFTDIRKQLLASAVIFLLVFGLLRWFHPAFQMVRSSLMILLGFVILMLTLLVTVMVGGKFRQNLKTLRARAGSVEGTDINRGGVIGTAFMLGLNNMRRRKVRTGLTCTTLILITFAMICFTSVSTDLADVEYATGRSKWNGLFIRDPNYATLSPAQVGNIHTLYGERYPVAAIRWLTPTLSTRTANRVQNLELTLERTVDTGIARIAKESRVFSVVELPCNEPDFSGFDHCLLTHSGWFPCPPITRVELRAAAQSGLRPYNSVMLPVNVAHDLGLTPEDVDRDHPVVSLRGQDYRVQGIFDPVAADRITGPDGRPLFPYDLNTVQQLGVRNNTMIIPEGIGRLRGSQVVIVNKLPRLAEFEQATTAFCSVLFPKTAFRLRADEPEFPAVTYREQRQLVADYLERMGQAAHYAVDGTAYYGYRRRATTVAGLLQLFVPLLIAALTVFNTMRGSVYERKSEIYVYNAVGIAPNHVFFMFMAEACVYAVIGAMAGYVLSQGTGRLLTALNLTGGLNMDYSSIQTIYASLAIMAAVFISTIIPARDAARLASPSGVASWSLPKLTGDTMELNLPFTFTRHDRVAVLSYFHRWLEANGAGSSGPFYCGPPEIEIHQHTESVPQLAGMVWLKPYDLGVSQRIEIALPTDPETSEYVARVRLTRVSGNLEAWHRTVRPFLKSLRQQFLNWRAVTDTDRQTLFTESRQLLNHASYTDHRHQTLNTEH